MNERLTEAEWERRRAQQECSRWGHEWSIVRTMRDVPIRLVCERDCGGPAYKITPLADE